MALRAGGRRAGRRLVSSSQAKRLAEMGLLRPSFVPPAEVRALRDYTRTRLHLVQDRTREYQRLEKLLEGALIKVSSVASRLSTMSARDMVRALADGERDPATL